MSRISELWRAAKRLLSGSWWGSDVAPARQNPGASLFVLAMLVALLGVADHITGPVLSMAAFYLIPTAIGTFLGGRRPGILLALESGLATTIAAFFSDKDDPFVFVSNGVLLFTILSVLVVLIAAAREEALAAGDAARQRKEFLSYAAHQLRTPLAGIRASTDALLVNGATSQQERLLVNLSREADRAGRLLSSLLQMARVDQGEVGTLQTIDVVDLCQAELDRSRSGNQTVKTSLVVRGARPQPVLLSSEATKNALANLLDNARRHARAEVTVEVGATPAMVEIGVADDGPGLPDGGRERVFERFVSLDGKGGSGLGLPIARGLIEAQGGRLTYEDRRFMIRLPNRRPVPTPTPSPS
ncbi:MAG: two-component system, OmpR family, sensor kinase [Acidimicrobiaceae bacterium]|nr:two-component system, OmpR family, sensor kinase [Acidimicrobiaceae bacterium]